MDNKKSLGSTPIGYNINPTNYSFIRDIGNGKESTNKSKDEILDSKRSPNNEGPTGNQAVNQTTTSIKNKVSEKKVVSYYIEVDLVTRLKEIADKTGTYYSTVVSSAIQDWLKNHGH